MAHHIFHGATCVHCGTVHYTTVDRPERRSFDVDGASLCRGTEFIFTTGPIDGRSWPELGDLCSVIAKVEDDGLVYEASGRGAYNEMSVDDTGRSPALRLRTRTAGRQTTEERGSSRSATTGRGGGAS